MPDGSLSGDDIIRLLQKADQESGASSATSSTTPVTTATPATPLSGDDIIQRFQNADKAAQTAPTQAPVAATGGILRNAAAGATDVAANVVNTATDPFGNLVGKPLGTAAVFAHDALAPYLGYNRFDDATRNMLLGDTFQQPGSRVVDTVGRAVGFDPSTVTADTPAEQLTRKLVGGAGSAAVLGPIGLRNPLMGAAGAATGDIASREVPDWAKPATELAGNVVGATVAGPASDLLTAPAKAITGTGGGISPPIADLARTARDKYGIPITAPQLSENSLVRTLNDQSSKLPFSGAGANRAAQDEAWHAAVDKEMGGSGSATFADPKVMAANAKRITGVMDDVASRTNIDTNTDPLLLNDLADIEARAHSGQVPLAQGGLASIDANIRSVQNSAAAGNGIIPGDVYQKMTMTNSPLDRASNGGDVHTQGYNQEIMDALDRAHQRAASPADQVLLGQARGQYRVLKTVEPLAASSTDGTIPPASLMTKVNSQSRRFDPSTGGVAYTGGGNLGELAKIGKQFLGPQPNSGTADRILINSLLGGGSILGGGAAAVGMINPLSLAGIPAGLVGNRLAGAYLRSGGLANRLINSSVNPPGPRAALLPSAALTGSLGYNALAAPPDRR